MHMQGFADLWEHVRLLSDTPRNEALLAMLARRAPDARVLEIGCGSGLLSVIAAKLGARKVYAVEPTAQSDNARALVAANKLEGVVEVIDGLIQDVEPREVDVAFSELLNADPFREEVLQAMDGAAPWVVPGGQLLPRRLKVWLSLVRENTSAVEARTVRRTLLRLADKHDLDLSPLLDSMDRLTPFSFIAPQIDPITAPICIVDLPLGVGLRPPEWQRVRIPVEEPGQIGGAAVWFEAELDDGIVMHNGPGHPGHWGHLVHGWAEELPGVRGGEVDVDVDIDIEEGSLVVRPAR